MYSVTIVGNVEQCRTEAEISSEEGVVVAVVYEATEGWQTDILEGHSNHAASDFKSAVDCAIENLSHYVNRRGENAPEHATRGAIALWLMLKADGSAMGFNMKDTLGRG